MKYEIETVNALKIAQWFANGARVAVWQNVDLSSPDIGCLSYTPVRPGAAPRSPHWRNGSNAIALLLSFDRFEIVEPEPIPEAFKPKRPPSIKKIASLLRSLKSDICDDYRASDDPDDTTPGIQVTIGFSPDDGSWDYQTGDNSYSGGAYCHPVWAVIYLYRRSNCMELAREAIGKLVEGASV